MHSFQLAIKRFFDILLCLIILIVCAPLFVAIAILIKLTSEGPVFFVQERVGLHQKIFRMIKFRTMTVGSTPTGLTWTQQEEQRITPLGRFLRDYGLDELPQAINILKGDMSIVGPRPPLPDRLGNYTEYQRKAFEMRPGVISLAAVEGRRSIPMEKRLDLHARYVEKWSLWLDIQILWRALFVVLGRQYASEIVTDS
jgi:undecaprenyl phosphate N,N'-diacetylbacillosamine 1-phosphate transferase